MEASFELRPVNGHGGSLLIHTTKNTRLLSRSGR
jgi:hypothetical protein